MTGNRTPKGFTLFFAMLTASLALAVGLSIYDLTMRQIDLASAATQSQYAIYASDMGAECALYWDYKAPLLNGSPSAFATSTAGLGAPAGASLWCNAQNIRTQPPPAIDLARYSGCVAGSWCVLPNTSDATTVFSITISSGGTATYCAVVEVVKSTDASGVLFSTITSRGYNTCTPGPTRYERALQLSY